jgi:PHD/YefM family antitoxin component YafN of YafNO toxin-antitoxin module
MTIHAQILTKNGKKEFAIMSYKDFLKVQETLEDYEDLRALRAAKAKEKSAKSISLKEAKRVLNLN